MHDVGIKLALIGFAGIAAQWIAWRIHLPAIALLFAAGLIAGPVTGFIDPIHDFGEVYRPVISLAVAIILFEGGMSLNFSEIRETSKAVRRIIIIGGPLVWAMSATTAHYVGGLTWQTSAILGAILVVTGPTVIMPLLRQANLKARPASLLRWEAIINDPIGALFAVLAFETFLVINNVHDIDNLLIKIILALIIAIPLAWGFAKFIIWAFIRGHVPEFLKAPVLVTCALIAFASTNMVLEEAGLLTVTTMGIVLGNSRLASLTEMRRFKETITVMLVSAVFIMLTASLNFSLISGLGWNVVYFIIVILFIVRPIAIFTATIGTGLTWQERLLTMWIAPRGIVAVAVSGLFGATLVDQGIADGEKLLAFTFAVVAATIILHGFSLPILAKFLDLKSTQRPGILFIGCSPWTVAFAEKLKSLEIPVLISDNDWKKLQIARAKNIPTFFGDALSESAHHHLAITTWAKVIAATNNDAYNALICTEFGPEVGRGNVFQIGERINSKDSEAFSDRNSLRFTVGGRQLTSSGDSYFGLLSKYSSGWSFSSTQLTKEFTFADFQNSREKGSINIMWFKPNNKFHFASDNEDAQPSEGNIILSFGPRQLRDASNDQPEKDI
ncbi:MAG: sodium:proton antiporter [Rhizobiales bacterium]|nr:sodium:proton antiporter [Hyphomicrobiales bacterium]